MLKFKHLFLTILLGSFVSSNNIGYSSSTGIKDNNFGKRKNYNSEIWLLKGYSNGLQYNDNCKNNKLQFNHYDTNCTISKYLNDIASHINSFIDAVKDKNISNMNAHAKSIIESINKTEQILQTNPHVQNSIALFYESKQQIRIIEKLLHRIKYLVPRIFNKYYNLIINNDGILISYSGKPISNRNDFQNINSNIQRFLNDHGVQYPEIKSSINPLIQHISNFTNTINSEGLSKDDLSKFDNKLKNAFDLINKLLETDKNNNLKESLKDIKKQLIDVCIYYINNIIYFKIRLI